MHILIHALSMREYGGTARHLRSFVPALGRYSPETTYTLVMNSDFDFCVESPNVQVERVQMGASVRRAAWDQIVLPMLARRLNADAVWCLLGFGSFLGRVPQIVFERDPTYYCPYHLELASQAERIDLAVRRTLQYLAMRNSRAIVCPTDAMRDMIRRMHPSLAPARFVTLPHAFEPAMVACSGEASPLARDLAQSRESAGVTLLFVGHILPYKRLDLLLRALKAVQEKAPSLKYRVVLTIAGEDWPAGYDGFMSLRSQLGLEQRTIVIGKAPPAAMGQLYAQADGLLFTSLCEAFGWPMIEASSLGLPSLAADVPLNREMLGDGGVYFKPKDVDSLCDAFIDFVSNEGQRRRVGELARQHCGRTRVGWEEYVRRLVALTCGETGVKRVARAGNGK